MTNEMVEEVLIPSKSELQLRDIFMPEGDVLLALLGQDNVSVLKLTENVQYWIGESSVDVISASIAVLRDRKTIVHKSVVAKTLLGWYDLMGVYAEISSDPSIQDLCTIIAHW